MEISIKFDTKLMGELRRSRGLSQRQLADQLQISLSQLRKIEQGVRLPTLILAYRIASFYNMSIDDFVKEE